MSAAQYVDGVLRGDRTVLGRAITLVESTKAEHKALAQQVLLEPRRTPQRTAVSPASLCGADETRAGTNLTAATAPRCSPLIRRRRTGGSILGDRTRMHRLSTDCGVHPPVAHRGDAAVPRPRARPSWFEAAGFDVVLVETVGVGQSETLVANMVDFFLVLMIAGAGDELQGIKKGVLELADMIAVNKADGDNERAAQIAAREYQHALRLVQPASPTWLPTVLTCSALRNTGLDTIWSQIELHRRKLGETGEFDEKRRRQQVDWMWSTVDERLRHALRTHPEVRTIAPALEADLRAGRITPTLAADRILAAFDQD
jgi:LAO/AO transport system kinase